LTKKAGSMDDLSLVRQIEKISNEILEEL